MEWTDGRRRVGGEEGITKTEIAGGDGHHSGQGAGPVAEHDRHLFADLSVRTAGSVPAQCDGVASQRGATAPERASRLRHFSL